jgi:hypothetical protein
MNARRRWLQFNHDLLSASPRTVAGLEDAALVACCRLPVGQQS